MNFGLGCRSGFWSPASGVLLDETDLVARVARLDHTVWHETLDPESTSDLLCYRLTTAMMMQACFLQERAE